MDRNTCCTCKSDCFSDSHSTYCCCLFTCSCGCGAVVVDDYMCVGCGICTTKCKFDAIHLERVSDFKGTPYGKTLLGVVGYLPTAVGKTVSNKIRARKETK